MRDEAVLDELTAAVRHSRKYRHISPDLVRRIAEQELSRRHNARAALKATRDKLHQVAGAYLAHRVDYATWLERLRTAAHRDAAEFRHVCREAMAVHTSTRERLPILDRFYTEALCGTGPIRSVLDVACGLNPLAIPWMPLAEDAEYYAYDIYEDMMGFVDEFLPLAGVRGQAVACDVVAHYPTRHADLALVLKAIPCLEQIDKAAGRRLLEGLDAAYLLVSFPARSLGGARKGMPATYEAHFRELVAGSGWSVRRHEFPGELAFLVGK